VPSVPAPDPQSLRPWLAELADDGRLVEIGETLDPAAGLAARLVAHDREPVRIAHVHGSDLPLVANLLPSRALIAEALGVREHDLGGHLQRALEAPLDPVIAREAPCQELVEPDPDLARLPIPTFFEHEGGPYITAGCIVTRDPETGERNWSIARVRPLGGSRALVGIAPNHHLAVAGRAARERGERLPIAVTIGNHPALMIAACLYLARGEDELRVAGGLLGEPVGLVRCAEVPLEVPAGCEIVLEGELDLGETVEEGPVSEFHGGYERYGQAATATFACLTRRSDALYQAVLPGFHPEHVLLGGVAIAAGLQRRLRGIAPSVHAVAVPESGAGRLAAVVALGPHAAGEAGAVARAALEAVNLVKLVTMVDADVDPWDDAAVAHAVATRVHFDRDLTVLPGMRADRAEPLERGGAIAKLVIDATRKAGDRDDWTPAEPPSR
jgi:4-hydroxy-3-polyprenylbenzoate decarboxylase